MAIEDIVINATARQIEEMATRQISQEITEDSSADELASASAVYNALKNAGTGDGIAPLIVTLDETTGRASHTGAKIFEYCNNGGMVLLYHSNNYIPFIFASQESALFEAFNETILLIFEIKSDGSYSVNDVEYATADDIGDISTALDGIIALQQSYIREDI